MLDKEMDVWDKMMQQTKVSERQKSNVFPASLVLEAHDQHSRWFLTSLVTSVALTGTAPFRNLKTQGLLLDDNNEPMAYLSGQDIDPTDLIEGTVKLSGQRMHGYGLDTMRAWAISQDSDTSVTLSVADIDNCNQQLKTIRHLIRTLLINVQEYDGTQVEFNDMTFLDKLMMREVLLFA